MVSLLEEGKTLLLNGQFEQAADKLGEALGDFTDKYGETGPECGEVYYLYGKALLNIVKHKNHMFANSVLAPQATEGQDPEDTEQEGGEAGEAGEEGEEGGEGEGEEGEEEGEEGENADEDQIAFEVLELARVIYGREEKEEEQEEKEKTGKGKEKKEEEKKGSQKERERKKNLAKVMMTLGDLHMEIENFPRAVEDYLGCLENLVDLLDPLDRQNAEIFFKLSLAYNFNKEFEKAKEAILKSIGVIENRIASLKQASTEDSAAEIEELEELLAVMKEKLDDLEFQISNPTPADATSNLEFLASLFPTQERGFGKASSSSFPSSSSSSSTSSSSAPAPAPVNNLTNLVRSKKAQPDSTTPEKKPAEDEEQKSSKKRSFSSTSPGGGGEEDEKSRKRQFVATNPKKTEEE